MGQRDPLLDRWWTPPELALLWGCSPNTARSRLRELLRHRSSARLVARGKGTVREHLRVHGRALEQAAPGCLQGARAAAAGPRLSDVRAIRDELEELRGWRDQTDEWRESLTTKVQGLGATG